MGNWESKHPCVTMGIPVGHQGGGMGCAVGVRHESDNRKRKSEKCPGGGVEDGEAPHQIKGQSP